MRVIPMVPGPGYTTEATYRAPLYTSQRILPAQSRPQSRQLFENKPRPQTAIKPPTANTSKNPLLESRGKLFKKPYIDRQKAKQICDAFERPQSAKKVSHKPAPKFDRPRSAVVISHSGEQQKKTFKPPENATVELEAMEIEGGSLNPMLVVIHKQVKGGIEDAKYQENVRAPPPYIPHYEDPYREKYAMEFQKKIQRQMWIANRVQNRVSRIVGASGMIIKQINTQKIERKNKELQMEKSDGHLSIGDRNILKQMFK